MASSKFSTVRQKKLSLSLTHCFFKMLFSDYSAEKNKNNNGGGSSGVLDKNARFLS